MNNSDDIVKDFLAESHQQLDQFDRSLVSLGKHPLDREVLASAFRAIHTIRGTAGFLAFSQLEAITDIGESLLGRLRDGQIQLTPEITAALLVLAREVRRVVARIEASGGEGVGDHRPLIASVIQLLAAPVRENAAAVEELRRPRESSTERGTALIRVLVVDDSAVIRMLLSEVLSSDPKIEVVAAAESGNLALSLIPRLKPDLVTLDVEMPGLDGIETLKEIRRLNPNLPVIMFSSYTERGAAITLEALALGATDYVTKPAHAGSRVSASQKVRDELIPKIKALCEAHVFLPRQPALAAFVRPRIHASIDIVAIGTSTGGPNALTELVPQFPADFPVPILIVQHMPPMFTRLLAERLNALTLLLVEEAREGKQLAPGQVWIAPGDYHMTVVRNGSAVVLAMNQRPAEQACRPAVDVLFRSVAQAFGPHALGVVLTGMGADGTCGAHAIRQAGGEVIVQDEATSVIWGMPGRVVAAGQADHIYPLGVIASEIVRRVNTNRQPARAAAAAVGAR